MTIWVSYVTMALQDPFVFSSEKESPVSNDTTVQDNIGKVIQDNNRTTTALYQGLTVFP